MSWGKGSGHKAQGLVCGLAAAMLALGAGIVSVRASGSQQAVFRASVDRVRVDALVTRVGQPVAGLAAADFEVLDNGVPQTVELSTTAAKVSAVLLLDVSGSVKGRNIERFVDAVRTFSGALVPGDVASLVSFSRRLELEAGAVSDPALIREALGRTEAEGSTAMWDALVAGASLAPAGDSRALAVVFTDGIDTYSYLSEKKALACLDRSNVVVYAVWAPPTPQLLSAKRVVVGSPASGVTLPPLPAGTWAPLPSGGPPAAMFSPFTDALARLVARTGGSVWPAAEDAELPRQFVSVLQEFRSRYLLIYEPTGVRRDDGWHEVKVRVKDGRAIVTARPGYYAGARQR